MRAWQVAELGEPAKVMQLVDLPDPEPGPRQLVVKVLASPANFPDALMCRGLHAVGLIGLPVGRVLLIDDADPNILEAQACGLRVLRHTSTRCTRAALAALVPDLSVNLRGVST